MHNINKDAVSKNLPFIPIKTCIDNCFKRKWSTQRIELFRKRCVLKKL